MAEIEAIRFAPVGVEIATKSVDLPATFHNDPADRIIVATARKFAAPLVTKYEKFAFMLTLRRFGENTILSTGVLEISIATHKKLKTDGI